MHEPFPGWTDSIGLVGGLILIAGLGILREIPGDVNNIGDIVPVDLVVNQLLASIPATVKQARIEKKYLFLTHCCTSSTNPLRWGEVISNVLAYWSRNPIEARIANPSVVMYKSKKVYQTIFKIKRKIPMLMIHKLSRLIGTKDFKSKMTQLKEAVDKCEEVGFIFEHFTMNEWIFSN